MGCPASGQGSRSPSRPVTDVVELISRPSADVQGEHKEDGPYLVLLCCVLDKVDNSVEMTRQ